MVRTVQEEDIAPGRSSAGGTKRRGPVGAVRGSEASGAVEVFGEAVAGDAQAGRGSAESEVILSEGAIAAVLVTRPALRYHGGKFRLAPKLIAIFPEHRVYTEAFGGGGSVLLCKPRCYAEIYNDLDGEVVNVFRVLQNRKKAAELERLLRVTPFAREEFLLSYKSAQSEVERARRTIIRSFMGFGSDSISRMKATRAGFNTRLSSVMSTGFRWNSNRSGTTAATDWARYPQQVQIFCERLQGVTIEQRDATDILTKMDREDCLHYVDPPYPMSVRRIGNGTSPEHRYRHEMTDEDHLKLAKTLRCLRGMVVISSYLSPLYERLYAGWEKLWWSGGHFCSGNTKGQPGNGQKRTEVVWLNEAAWKGSRRGLFG
jgi:DNA adenine methylase